MQSSDLLTAVQIGQVLIQQALDWQAATAAGSITPEQLDAKLAAIGIGSRADLVQAIADRRAADSNPVG